MRTNKKQKKKEKKNERKDIKKVMLTQGNEAEIRDPSKTKNKTHKYNKS